MSAESAKVDHSQRVSESRHAPPSLERSYATLDERLDRFLKRGVVIIDPRQCYVDESVRPEQIAPGVVLWPGTRLLGGQTWLGPGCEIGIEGPATIRNCVLERDVQVASGFLEGALCLRGVRIGGQAHIRPGTLLEEEASTAHCVGLKQTVLMSFVTLGSLINFCDCLMAGGSSRSDHAEVGSGFIHFNFTPWGEKGDKATPSLFGDVRHGVFLDQPRIFLGGLGGCVGPRNVGFGSVVAAGQVLREDVPEQRLVSRATPNFDRKMEPGRVDRKEARLDANRNYIAQLVALQAWYRDIRIPRANAKGDRFAIAAATLGAELLEQSVAERLKQLTRFLQERGGGEASLQGFLFPVAPQRDSRHQDHSADYVAWVQSLPASDKRELSQWLSAGIVQLERFAHDHGW